MHAHQSCSSGRPPRLAGTLRDVRRQRRGDGSHQRDEVLDGTRVRAGTGVADGNLSNHVLSLQRDYGNAAVTTVVQRKGGTSKAASTDAPGAKKKGKAAAKADYAPKEPGEATAGRTAPWLINQGNSYLKSWADAKTPEGKKMAFKQAERYYLGAMWIDPSPMNAQYLVKFYRTVGGDKDPKYLYWLEVQNRAITLTPHKAGEEDLRDRGF